ncbi:2,3-bisphosphoglycerate-independent phosphoglycerate mutase [Oscillatoria amoena NRMC-F 0135]|nr:2,3-bisphosphoglycerate-independent phosphoglycerate mutase [Oscillatoria amoena NRMC-F 0135]
MSKKPVVLIIRDGWGISPAGLKAANDEGNAPLLARTPVHDHLFKEYPSATLSASGEDVGLPAGQMGNSEVGHLNLGAGRIVYQDLTRIDKDIREGTFSTNPKLQEMFSVVKAEGKALHLIGLVSDGGVHSQNTHIYALLKAAKEAGLSQVYVHVITDGRDTSPTGGVAYVTELQRRIQEIGLGQIATVVGRYYAMDRDKRWERVQKAYDCIVEGKGEKASDPVQALKDSYAKDVTDEFVLPVVVVKDRQPIIQDGDTMLFFNFRSDRGRQMTQALMFDDFSGFDRAYRPKIHYFTMTQYDETYPFPNLYPPSSMNNIFGQVVSDAGLSQVRVAETEKYPHVTFFFNGGIEKPFEKEERILVSSPKVATYDLQPEMSAYQVTEELLSKMRFKATAPDVVILNYANPDMVGHTGSLKAAIKAVETVDECVGKVVDRVLSLGGQVLILADHGNCERMMNPDKSPHTAHTTNLVHVLYVAKDAKNYSLDNGILADVAPTMLALLEVPQPPEMTGKNLIHRR